MEHSKRRVRFWKHKGCGGEVSHESVGKGLGVQIENGVLIKESHDGKSSYKCVFCGDIPESEVDKQGSMIEESWEW